MTSTLIRRAIAAPTLDAAVRMIQDAIGITTGDVAAQVFSGLPFGDDTWPDLTPVARAQWLSEYLRVEALHAGDAAVASEWQSGQRVLLERSWGKDDLIGTVVDVTADGVVIQWDDEDFTRRVMDHDTAKDRLRSYRETETPR